MSKTLTINSVQEKIQNLIELNPALEVLHTQPIRNGEYKSNLCVYIHSNYGDNRIVSSIFEPVPGRYTLPNLNLPMDQIQKASKNHLKNVVSLFFKHLDKEIEELTYIKDFIKEHVNFILSKASRVEVLYASEKTLEVIAWNVGVRDTKTSIHTYSIQPLINKEKGLKPKPVVDTEWSDKRDQQEALLLKLLNTAYPRRRSVHYMSTLGVLGRRLMMNSANRDDNLVWSFERNTLVVDYPKEKVSLTLRFTDHIPTGIPRAPCSHSDIELLNNVVMRSPRKDSLEVWDFLSTSLKLKKYTTKASIAHQIALNTSVFYHPMEAYFLTVSLNY